MVARKRDPGIMSEFVGGGELLEEIVETTEEHDADLCSNGDTIEECSGLPLSDYQEEVELKPLLHQQAHSTSGLTQQYKGANNSTTIASASTTTSNGGSSLSTASSRSHASKRSHSTSSGQQQNLTINGTSGSRATSRSHMEQEKRMRREIANSNERRRMQSINAGFQSLRTLLPHHEGEKLSKAAILQQTAEYIYQLEQQKTQLLSQNLQLKRLVDQQEGGDIVNNKKRKNDNQGVVMSLPMHISESGDEGLGSMSPEPLSVITVSADGHAASSSSEVAELKRQLERERVARAHLEKQLRSIQMFPERYREEQLIAYQPHEVIEHTNNVIQQELDEGMSGLQVVSVVTVPTVGSTQTVETSTADGPDETSPPLSPQPGEIIVSSEDVLTASTSCGAKEASVAELLVESRPSSPKLVGFTFASSLAQADEQNTAVVPSTVTYTTSLPVVSVAAASVPEFKATANAAQFISSSPTRPFSPDESVVATTAIVTNGQQRLPSVLEAAMKAEPKVEVERLPSPSNTLDDSSPQARIYLANTSRQNLETIVEAIRHLEGDHLFSDEPAQDAPLALTNKPGTNAKQRLLHAEVNNFLQFQQQIPQAQPQQQQQQSQQAQQRPGVIVVKHS